MKADIIFWVHSYYGAGHYRRVANLAAALVRCDPSIRIALVYTDLPGLVPSEFRFFPSIVLPQATGESAGEIRSERLRLLRQSLRSARFSVAVLEFFPFARHELIDEVDWLVTQLRRNNPELTVVSSVRDIPRSEAAGSEPQLAWQRRVSGYTARYIDISLIHSDSLVVSLDELWIGKIPFADRLVYTGFVTAPSPAVSEGPAVDSIICFSVGSGAGERETAASFRDVWSWASQANGAAGNTTAYLFPGSGVDISQRDLGAGLRLGEWHQYRAIAARACLSISRCGYNTAYELLAWGVPSVFYPRAVAEQQQRARLFADLGWAAVALDRDALQTAIRRRLTTPETRSKPPKVDLSGATNSARILLSLAGNGEPVGLCDEILSRRTAVGPSDGG